MSILYIVLGLAVFNILMYFREQSGANKISDQKLLAGFFALEHYKRTGNKRRKLFMVAQYGYEE